ncbi:uncharacterized protein IL334_005017 [Kwoniella shivajii]|uniref:Sas10 C-terminal domain-containing protein n=1 Tax=Kwoniella shivajii TaxID=564305 RepID=A0ABZ1D366_9TREE|nr:hypothetical protein IL334_005017 [Kwoniella shivajii]
MAKKRSGKGGVSSALKASAAPGARISKIDKYEDTLEPGSVDDFIFKRDQISFNPQDDDNEDDINADEGEEVLSLKLPKRSRKSTDDDEGEEYAEEEEVKGKAVKQRKEKSKPDLNGKGRFGKAVVSSDEDDSGSGSGSSGSDSDTDDEAWGRQYYSKPSNRREKEEGKIDDEKREEEREMEEREVKRLQRKAREVLDAEDFGIIQDHFDVSEPTERTTQVEIQTKAVPAPPTSADPVALLRHLQAHEPVKLALARDFPLIVQKLEKTSRGIRKMEEQKEDGELHKGLGWLHYQTLLTYATTLAFYIHVSSLPPSARSESDFNIIPRLLQLKEGLSMLEDLDFAAGSVSDGAFALHPRVGLGEDETDEELKEGKMELLKRMQGLNGDEDDEENEWEDGDDGDDLWGKEGLEEGELEALLADAEEDEADELREMIKLSEKAKKKGKTPKISKDAEEDVIMEEPKKEKSKSKKKKAKKDKDTPIAVAEASTKPTSSFTPLAEPEFFSSSSKSKTPTYDDSDVLGDPTALGSADYADKQSKKRTLAFHTSKINTTLARRAEGRANRMGGDEDIPYRDRRKARDDALKRNQTQQSAGEDLDLDEPRPVKRFREESQDADANDDAEGYYELVKRRRKEEKDAKEAEHEGYEAEKLAAIASLDDPSHEGGPRALTRAIEKNRGLTPHRSKAKGGRNPRVKKRQQYEKAKKKVASQRSVYKGGQGAYGSDYKGEKTGISKVIKSRKF